MFKISLHWYGLIVGVAVLVSTELAKRLATDDQKKTIDGGFLPLLVGSIIGGRLYHVLDKIDFYRANPQNIFYLNQGGMGIFGAIIGGMIAAAIYLYITKKLNQAKDLAIIILTVLPLGQAIGRIGNYINRELFGLPTSLPWGMRDVSGTARHPLFFYEMFLDLILFVFLYFRPHKSQNIGLYLCGYGLIRLLLEKYREQSDTWIIAGFSMTRIISLFMILTGLFFYQKYAPKKNKLS